MGTDRGDLSRTTLQVPTVLCLIALFSTIFHKAFVDLAMLGQQHSGGEFWAALVRHILRNLAGA